MKWGPQKLTEQQHAVSTERVSGHTVPNRISARN